MTYYQQNNDLEDLICDCCGEARWEQHPNYGTNTDARLLERERTGFSWLWTNNYSTIPMECSICGGEA